MNRRLAAWGVAAAFAVALAWWSADGQVGEPATALGLCGAVLAGAIAVGAGALGRRWWWLGLVAVGVAAGQDHLRHGVSYAHDLTAHAWAAHATWRAVLDGDLWPRWTPYLGLGMPLLQFYGPLGYVATWPVQALGLGPVDALQAVFVATGVGSALSTALACRWLGHSRAASVLAGVSAALAPYALLDRTLRFALGEALGLVWMPLVLAAGVLLLRSQRGCRRLGLSTGLLILSHPLSVILAAAAAVPLVIGTAWLGWAGGWLGVARRLGAAALIALLLTAWWLGPWLLEARHTSLHKVAGGGVSAYAALPLEPVKRRPWKRYGIRRSVGKGDDPGEELPLYFGLGLCALAGLGAGAPRRGRPGDSGSAAPVSSLDPADAPAPSQAGGSASERAPTASMVEGEAGLPAPPHPALFATSALLVLLLATWPAAWVLDWMPGLNRIQFPWRLYAPATVLATFAAAGALDRWAPAGRWRSGLLAAAVAGLLLDAVPYLGAPARLNLPPGLAAGLHERVDVVDADPGRFLRVEGMLLPPSAPGWKVARTRVLFPEFLNPQLRARYGLRRKPPSRSFSEELGVHVRVERGRAEYLQPQPPVRFRPQGGQWRALPGAAVQRRPERIEVSLPPDLPAGRVRVAEGWFVGWQARVDGRAVGEAVRSQGLLAVDVPEHSGELVLTYSAWRPLHRPLSSAVSVLGVIALLALQARRRSLAP